MDRGTVYHIFNTLNGKCYVGQTWKTPEERWAQHCRVARGTRAINLAIRKYGKSAFVMSVLTVVFSQRELDEAEAYWIRYFASLSPGGYNLREGGRARGKMSDESRAMVSASKMGHIVSTETRSKISVKVSASLLGNKRSLGWKPPQAFVDKMTEINRHRARDPEDRRKKSEGVRAWWARRKENG